MALAAAFYRPPSEYPVRWNGPEQLEIPWRSHCPDSSAFLGSGEAECGFAKLCSLLGSQMCTELPALPQHHREGQGRHGFHAAHRPVEPAPVEMAGTAGAIRKLLACPVRLGLTALHQFGGTRDQL